MGCTAVAYRQAVKLLFIQPNHKPTKIQAMTNIIITLSETYVSRLLREQLTPDHRYHNLEHTLSMRDECLVLGKILGISEDDMETLELAALFHDTGFINCYDNHEAESCKIAETFLSANGYPAGRIQPVVQCIQATALGTPPSHRLHEIVKDADLSHLGRNDYADFIETLRHEWLVFRNEAYTQAQWYKLNHQFLKNHQYLTYAARERYDDARRQNQRLLKDLSKTEEEKEKRAADGTSGGIVNSRSAQMMFKTALRNHIDLSNLADNKANMMLSVNALIITIAMPLGFSQTLQHSYMLPALIIILLASLSSMIFATLATRPMRMQGYTKQEDIAAGRANLFFFGNFFAMSLQEFESGMDQVLQQDANLESAIKRDLYFLGRSLGRKFQLLRMCYNVFMVGVIIAIIVFAISFCIQLYTNP